MNDRQSKQGRIRPPRVVAITGAGAGVGRAMARLFAEEGACIGLVGQTAGPYRFTVEAERTRHLRFNDFADPEPVPHDTDYASVIESDVSVIVQHTRLDSRQPAGPNDYDRLPGMT